MKKLHSRFALLLVVAALTASAGLGQLRSGKFGVGVGGSGYIFTTDETGLEAVPKFGAGLGISWSIMEHVGLRANFSSGQIGWKQSNVEYVTSLFSGSFYVSGDLLPHGKLNPFVYAGVVGLYYDPRGPTLLTPGQDKFDIAMSGGAGVDFFLSEFMSITASGEIVLTNTDNLEGLKVANSTNDYYIRAGLEFRYYFFDQDFITKLLEAVKAKK